MITEIIKIALFEDIQAGDKSASLLVDEVVKAQVICREDAVISGFEYFEKCFENIQIIWHIKECEKVEKNTILCTLTGNNKEIITKERTALNFLQTLSGVATKTYKLTQIIKDTQTKILDTRKTLPGLRVAQKNAVVCGGGVNHRMGLYDEIMLKENHIKLLGIKKAVEKAQKTYPNTPIIVEVENLDELKISDDLKVKRILCDNFDTQTLTKAKKFAKTTLEASGNIDENNILEYAKTGVDYISIGSITKNIQAIDLSLNIVD
jgi:nicotinate-nucleotide pyrophosphorylase (carboxylating)